ncbi:hypothetical protein M2459_000243 [Parabacteroides sp. PF5-5]|uniref:hypothetical protein n=1 Tax=unclassified Parabacteroides TaxID=2649774 RepID=UPI002476E658|nr:MULTISPECIES: hypothetical protein [unclassified Parabacteroides]MDH6303911.1 hypothetical protein [Parabacteroides sp. PH5-39]MDH6314528.1 hypothetical protein [Parabacteroides sp. PF5-13]MDH6318407.1 hypothetical protein [Parabacteroides sp. PH5-13]MDH6322300.1 hypothetical protein [Parabacteroides sp. PH5-8]MDH6325620.1 hypothetical protein [Parabacteroides sp. PH5-41]
MKRIFLIFAVFLSIENYAFSQVCERLLEDGKKAYNTGNYSKARDFFIEGTKNCNDIDFQSWVNACDKRIKETKVVIPNPPTVSSPCTILMQKGEEKYNSSNYEEAKAFFKSASESGCTEADDWIKRIEKKENEMLCENAMHKGGFHYDRGEYSIALTYFEYAANNDCSGADVWIQRCKRHITFPLDLTDVRRLINRKTNLYPTQSFDNGDYLGEVLSTQRNGMGIYTWADGSIYVGEFRNNHRSETGIYIVPDGYFIPNCIDCKFYVGGWSNDRRKGAGFCYDETGKVIYYGSFANSMPLDDYPSTSNISSHKFEIIKYGDDTYLGQTKDGKAHGKGLYFWSKENMWYGQWEDGKRAGHGMEIKSDGSIITGYWIGDSYSKRK